MFISRNISILGVAANKDFHILYEWIVSLMISNCLLYAFTSYILLKIIVHSVCDSQLLPKCGPLLLRYKRVIRQQQDSDHDWHYKQDKTMLD